MTFCFIQAIEHNPVTTYGGVLTAMRTAIRDAGGSGSSVPDIGGGMVTSLLSMLVSGGSLTAGGFSQVLFSSSDNNVKHTFIPTTDLL